MEISGTYSVQHLCYNWCSLNNSCTDSFRHRPGTVFFQGQHSTKVTDSSLGRKNMLIIILVSLMIDDVNSIIDYGQIPKTKKVKFG